MGNITNEFGWSKTRHAIFESCERSYFLRYYQSWDGWNLNAPKEKRDAYVLKNLENRWSWSGKVSHATMSEALELIRLGQPMDPEQLIDRAHRTMKRDFIQSKQRSYWRGKPRKDFGGLMEHELGEPITEAEWKAVWENTKAGLVWWFGSRWPALARQLKPQQWLATDTKDFNNIRVDHRGIPYYGLPDFAYLDEKGAVIVDWKTGKPRGGFDGGVVGYALFLQEKFGIDAATMRGWMVYLHDGSEKEMEITQGTIDSFNSAFDSSVNRMKEKLLGKGRENRPLPAEAFPKTKDLGACGRCAYRRICGREKT